MSKATLPDRPARVKSESSPHPIFATLRRIEASCRERDRIAAENLRHLGRVLEGRDHV